MPNPYVQVALTYVRRPLSSWQDRLLSVAFVFFLLIPLLPIGRFGVGRELDVRHLLLFVFLFAYLAAHAKGQFANWRARLIPGFRRVHATVAAVAALIFAVILPAMLTCFLGWHSIGLVAVAVLLFGTTLWVIVKDATWTSFAMLAGWSAVFGTESGRAWFQGFVSGQFEPQAMAILGLGGTVTLLAGIRLVRLSEEVPGYHTELRWDWDWSQKVRQAQSDRGRILPGLMDWIRERQMARLTRLARQASQSWWSRICRWQVGMVTGWPLWFWILGTLIHVQAAYWLILTKTSTTVPPMMGVTSIALTFVPAIGAMGGVFYRGMFQLGHELLLPVERKSYIRQLGMAAAVSHFQLWGGISVALVLWWMLIGPQSLPLAMLAGVLAFSAAFQVVVFGVAFWTARYRSRALGGFAMAMLLPVAALVVLRWRRGWFVSSPEELPHEVIWTAISIAVLGLLITFDAYRRWLAADFD